MHCQCVRECVVLLVCPINVRDSVCRVRELMCECMCCVCVCFPGAVFSFTLW